MYKFIKGAALFIPTVISIVLIVVVLLKLPGTVTDIKIVELKMDSLIGIIGVAVSVWIGLNIYNVIEGNEIEKLQEDYNDNINNLKLEFEEKVNELDKKSTEVMSELFCIDFLRESDNFERCDDYIKEVKSCSKLLYKFTKYNSYEDSFRIIEFSNILSKITEVITDQIKYRCLLMPESNKFIDNLDVHNYLVYLLDITKKLELAVIKSAEDKKKFAQHTTKNVDDIISFINNNMGVTDYKLYNELIIEIKYRLNNIDTYLLYHKNS